MKRSEKAHRILAQLEGFYPETPVPLDHTSPFELLVAVLLSAQTTDLRVNLVTPDLFRKANTPAAMARLEVDDILASIKTCGLAPTKAKNIRRLAEMLVEEHGGEVPASLEALEALPGVGHKTASVVMAQSFGVPTFPVDTHIHRLAARWGLSNDTTVEKTEADLKAVFPRETWNKVHLQIIFFGREHCPARYHDLSTCPICAWASSKTRQAQEKRRDASVAKKRRPQSPGRP
ncbi:Endonuclease III [Planctomycetes bacterium Poly30]|uniref:Endonuclease III n=1 Tax=Saltatorellus ferox TaxID=2528018 RepID=A0A518EQP6_9BACT|nr:Endonuclease III [Planctomycetes bacterium Poly30]